MLANPDYQLSPSILAKRNGGGRARPGKGVTRDIKQNLLKQDLHTIGNLSIQSISLSFVTSKLKETPKLLHMHGSPKIEAENSLDTLTRTDVVSGINLRFLSWDGSWTVLYFLEEKMDSFSFLGGGGGDYYGEGLGAAWRKFIGLGAPPPPLD